MAIRCNVCSQDIDEKEVESHIGTQKHNDNKARLSKKNEKGSDLNVVKVWQDSFGSN